MHFHHDLVVGSGCLLKMMPGAMMAVMDEKEKWTHQQIHLGGTSPPFLTGKLLWAHTRLPFFWGTDFHRSTILEKPHHCRLLGLRCTFHFDPWPCFFVASASLLFWDHFHSLQDAGQILHKEVSAIFSSPPSKHKMGSLFWKNKKLRFSWIMITCQLKASKAKPTPSQELYAMYDCLPSCLLVKNMWLQWPMSNFT